MLHTEFEQIYTFENHPLSEDEVTIPADGHIDFESLIRDYLLMEIPFNPICQEDCLGLCSICGQNLNKKICEHQNGDHLEVSAFKEKGFTEKADSGT